MNINQLSVGTGDLGLPPDIWNLPDHLVALGEFSADWRELGLAYSTPEWWREAKPGTCDYNNDLTTSDTPGAVWRATITGSSIAVNSPKEAGAGSIEISIDDVVHDTADLSTTGARQPRAMLSEVTGLSTGQHSITITHNGGGPVAVDALVVRS